MEVKKEKSIVTVTRTLEEFFESKEAAKEFVDNMNSALSYPYQPERLSEKARKGSDSLNSMET